MSYESMISLVKRKWGVMILIGLFAGSVAFFSFVFFSKHFKVTTDFLVVQTGTGQSQDFYAMLKSSEYLGKVLAQSVGSEKFIDAVIGTGGIDENFLPKDPKDRLDRWAKTVKVSSNPDVGSLHILVYGDSDRDALRVAQAVGQVLTEKNALFRSGDEKSVEIRTLSGPIVEKNPELRYLIAVSIAGFALGISAFLFFALIRLDSRSEMLSLSDVSPEGSVRGDMDKDAQNVHHVVSEQPSGKESDDRRSIDTSVRPSDHLIFDAK